LAAKAMVTPMHRDIYGKPATPSLQPSFSSNVIGRTEGKRKVTHHAKAIHNPKAKTTISVMSILTALTDEL